MNRLTASRQPEDTEIRELPKQADNLDIRRALHADMVRLQVECRDLTPRLWLAERRHCGEPRTDAALERTQAIIEVALGRTEAMLERSETLVRENAVFARLYLGYTSKAMEVQAGHD